MTFFTKSKLQQWILNLISVTEHEENSMNYKGLLVGLGNPGHKYVETRHNIGFIFIDYLLEQAERHGQMQSLSGAKFKCELWKARFADSSDWWLLAKPQTFMNLSGQSVQPLLAWHKLLPENLIVIHDELDITPGALRFKFGGGNAGHNGLKSINQMLGTPDFYRLRLGIGRPTRVDNGEAVKGDVSSFVLSRPSADDQEKIFKIFPKAEEVLQIFHKNGLKDATAHALKKD